VTSDKSVIHAPFKRLHAVMYLLTIAAIGAPAGLIVYALTLPVTPERRAELMLGLGVVAAMSLGGLVIFWVAYLGNQRAAYFTASEIRFRPWIQFGGLGKERVLPLADVHHVVLLRPHHIEFSIPDAETHVGTFWRRLRGVDRVGTFWWRHDDYVAFERRLNELGVTTEYRHVVGIGTLLTSY
jgi:hypothetical protein